MAAVRWVMVGGYEEGRVAGLGGLDARLGYAPCLVRRPRDVFVASCVVEAAGVAADGWALEYGKTRQVYERVTPRLLDRLLEEACRPTGSHREEAHRAAVEGLVMLLGSLSA